MGESITDPINTIRNITLAEISIVLLRILTLELWILWAFVTFRVVHIKDGRDY